MTGSAVTGSGAASGDAAAGGKRSELRVVIIGGGGTGAAIAYDCAMRGYRVALLERGSLTSGTTGRHHGLLHSGARYVDSDPQAAAECWQEAQILKRITDGVIENNGGYFVSLRGIDDPQYAERFEEGCAAAGIPIRAARDGELRGAVPMLADAIGAAYAVPDASFDAWRLPMQFFASAMAHGAIVRQFCEVIDIEVGRGAIEAVRYRDYAEGRERRIRADVVINAAGAWAARVAALCSVSIAITMRAGTMVAVKGRLCNHVLNRLAPPGDGDIIVPQRMLTIIGTTSYDCEDIDAVEGSADEMRYLQRRADELLPGFSKRAVSAVWGAVRPLAGSSDGDASSKAGSPAKEAPSKEAPGKGSRFISRKLVCHNHRRDGVAGFFSIIGGKATTLRAMAEELVNEVVRDTREERSCATAKRPLEPFQEFYAYYESDSNRLAAAWD